jgi:hypothetical protein
LIDNRVLANTDIEKRLAVSYSSIDHIFTVAKPRRLLFKATLSVLNFRVATGGYIVC